LNSLTSKLENALSADGGEVVNKLNAFINQVEAQRGKKITEDDAVLLISMANNSWFAKKCNASPLAKSENNKLSFGNLL